MIPGRLGKASGGRVDTTPPGRGRSRRPKRILPRRGACHQDRCWRHGYGEDDRCGGPEQGAGSRACSLDRKKHPTELIPACADRSPRGIRFPQRSLSSGGELRKRLTMLRGELAATPFSPGHEAGSLGSRSRTTRGRVRCAMPLTTAPSADDRPLPSGAGQRPGVALRHGRTTGCPSRNRSRRSSRGT